jgi:hypothetical protein
MSIFIFGRMFEFPYRLAAEGVAGGRRAGGRVTIVRSLVGVKRGMFRFLQVIPLAAAMGLDQGLI